MRRPAQVHLVATYSILQLYPENTNFQDNLFVSEIATKLTRIIKMNTLAILAKLPIDEDCW